VKQRIEIDDTIRAVLNRIAEGQQQYEAGSDSYAIVELPKLALADAVLAAIAAGERRLEQLPARAVSAIAHCALPRRRRARRA
jgi:hypothetical protein